MPRPKSKSPKPKTRKSTPPADSESNVKAYRYNSKRKNIPPAGLAAAGKVREALKIEYAYNPHLPPVLRFDATGAADKLPELLQEARKRPLTADEAKMLADALRVREPWLEWSGKREKKGFEVDPVALHIHERIAAQAILQIAARENIQRSLFADPELSYREAIQFYQHEVDWANRMILGDSLQVMASLAHREGLAGKVQMIYIDPPYGINFKSNFQTEIGRREVEDRENDLTREPETIKAYRDTWRLGVHSYLAYLRDRLLFAKELLSDTGSIFVQISDDNVHRVRFLLDEVFHPDNFVSLISYKTTQSAGSETLDTSCDYLLWYARAINEVKFHPLYRELTRGEKGATRYDYAEDPKTGNYRRLTPEEQNDESLIPESWRLYTDQGLTSRGKGSDATTAALHFQGEEFHPTVGHWRTTVDKIQERVIPSERVLPAGKTLRFKKYFGDFGFLGITNLWDDVGGGIQSRKDPKIYAVQTANTIIQRCMLMTTDPGDLALDPTCGSGTTAYVAEQWGRRWITIDTSRVALALARQRVLTATFPYYGLRAEEKGVAGGFNYRKAPHIELGKSIGDNVGLDPILEKWRVVLLQRLAALNIALKSVTSELRQQLTKKLRQKEVEKGKKSITEADRRRWLLPKTEWKEWEVPFDSDEDWTHQLKNALQEYRAAWRLKMDEVNAAIEANAEPEELVDQPEEDKKVVRVSGPFTMEAVMPLEESLETESPIAGAPEEMDTFAPSPFEGEGRGEGLEPANAEAYLDKMLRLLYADGVRFPNNKVLKFNRLGPYSGDFLHGEGQWETEDGKVHKVAVSFGPEFGPVTVYQVERALRQAARRGFDDLVIAGFSFDAEAQATIDEDPNPDVRCHLAHIRPDVNMGDLLKETPNSQIFTVFGSPRTELHATKEGEFYLELQGVDIYNPVDNTILPTSADKVAAWFIDSDYDGRTFCITQAFFPDKTAWDKLARALRGVVDEERFAAFSGTTSLPFPPGKHKRAAVKVIDPRGNEVMRVHRLDDEGVRYDKR